jgi:alkylhydroperoxidase family enzyme
MAYADTAERTRASASRALGRATDLVSHGTARAGDTVQKAAHQIWSRAGDVADEIGSLVRAGARLMKRNRKLTVLSICAAAAIGYFAYLVLRPSNGSAKRH